MQPLWLNNKLMSEVHFGRKGFQFMQTTMPQLRSMSSDTNTIEDLEAFEARLSQVDSSLSTEPADSSNAPKVLLVDLTTASQANEAMGVLDCFLADTMALETYQCIELNTGNLILSPVVLSEMHAKLKAKGGILKTLYSVAPQTQMAAVSEGLFVKSCPLPEEERRGVSWGSASLGKVSPPIPATDSDDASVSSGDVSLASNENVDTSRFQVSHLPTLLVKQTVRSGQVVRYPGNIVVVGDVNPGSEIVADGDITVWGVLQGIAHAGAAGLAHAEVRALKIEAIQLRIHNTVARRPDRLFYHKSTQWSGPEVARVAQGEIQISSTNLVSH